jgi:hypothetical protein
MNRRFSDQGLTVTWLAFVLIAAALSWVVHSAFPIQFTFVLACMLSTFAAMAVLALCVVTLSDAVQTVLWRRVFTVEDHRGNAVEARHTADAVAQLRRLTGWKHPSRTWRSQVRSVALILGLTVILAATANVLTALGLNGRLIVGVTVAFVTLAALPWIGQWVRMGMARARCKRLLEHGWCGACGYPLQGLPVGNDGCVVCPECGAAWRRAPSPGGAAG